MGSAHSRTLPASIPPLKVEDRDRQNLGKEEEKLLLLQSQDLREVGKRDRTVLACLAHD